MEKEFLNDKGRYGIDISDRKYSEIGFFSEGFAKVKKDDKYSYIDDNGEEAMPFLFDEAKDFYQALAAVKNHNGWHYVDPECYTIIYDKGYEDVGSFSNGLAKVKKDGKWGFIDLYGKEAIPCVHDKAYSFFSNITAVQNGRKHYIITKNNGLWRFEPFKDAICVVGGIIVKDGRKWGYINGTSDGLEYEISPLYDMVTPFRDGFALVRTGKDYFFVPEGHSYCQSHTFFRAKPFSEGMAAVKNSKKNGKWGFVDTEFNQVTPFMYDDVSYFNEGLAKVKLDDKIGYIDKEGNTVIPFIYRSGEDFKNGVAAVRDGNGLNHLLSKDGNEIFTSTGFLKNHNDGIYSCFDGFDTRYLIFSKNLINPPYEITDGEIKEHVVRTRSSK